MTVVTASRPRELPDLVFQELRAWEIAALGKPRSQ
jgi:hypothetical protein